MPLVEKTRLQLAKCRVGHQALLLKAADVYPLSEREHLSRELVWYSKTIEQVTKSEGETHPHSSPLSIISLRPLVRACLDTFKSKFFSQRYFPVSKPSPSHL